MADTHDYPTKKVRGRDLDETMTLVGESGGLSSIYEAESSNIAFGMLNVTTEHGPLFLDPDAEYDVLDVAVDDDEPSELRHVVPIDEDDPTFQDTRWVIETYEDGSVDWWSNTLGWTSDRSLATEFTTQERYNFNLPFNGNWVEVNKAEGTGV